MSSDERQGPADDGTGPWWSGLGPVGGVVLRLPGTPDFSTPAYHQAARVLSVGVAVAGVALFSRSRTRSAGADETPEEDPESS